MNVHITPVIAAGIMELNPGLTVWTAITFLPRGLFRPGLSLWGRPQRPGVPAARLPGDQLREEDHDFNLDVPVRPDWRYVVQVRNPLDSIVSWHALNVRSVGETDAGPLDLWCRDRLHYWCGFVQKWLYSPVPHRLVVNYEDLLARPAEVVTNVVQFMCGTVTIDYDRVRQVLRDVPITPRSSGNRYCYARA